MLTDKFLSPKGDYKNLIAFRKSECIYDITLYFIEHYLPQIGDRTVDQMKQAARSGKQNIAEGNETGTNSMAACIKLVNVAKASLKVQRALSACRLYARLPVAQRHHTGQHCTRAYPSDRFPSPSAVG